VRIASVLLAVFCCLSVVGAQRLGTKTQPAASPQPGRDPNEVVRQVHSAGPNPGTSERTNPIIDDGEFLVDTSVTIVPAPGDQEYQAVAFDGANFLVVWEDNRSHVGSDLFDIYGARVTPQGTVLDPAGFVIAQAAGNRNCPVVGFDGTNFLVVWEDCRNDYWGDIYGARVTPQATVLDSGFVISQAANGQGFPGLAFDGANFLAVWHDRRGGSDCDIYGARVTPHGTVLDSAGIVIAQAANDQGNPRAVFDGANFLVVWGDLRSGNWDIYGARVSPQGTVLDPAGIVISQAAGAQRFPSLSFDGANYLAAWQSGSWDIYGARVTPQGTVLDPAGIVISQAADDQCDPAVDFDGANFLVAWDDYRSGWEHIYGARVTPAGVLLDPSGFTISQGLEGQQGPAVALDGANLLVVWHEWHTYGGDWDIYGARVTPQGTVLDSASIAISTTANWQASPALAFDSVNYLVAWQDRRSRSDWDIYGARVTPQGTVLDSAGIGISIAASWQASPALAFDGANFLAVWQDCRSDSTGDIYGTRVTPAGVVLDPSGFVISQAANGQHSPAVGFDGANYLVAWEDRRNDSLGDIYGTRVTPQGIVLDPSGIAVSPAAGNHWSPALGFDGANFLVTWSTGDIYGTRVTPAGVVLDPSGFVISQAANEQCYPVLAFDGANFLVVWEDHRNLCWDIYGARVTLQGTVLDPAGIAISQTTNDWCFPAAVGFDGANFLVVGEDGSIISDFDIYGARVTPGGTAFDGGPVVRQKGHQWYPRLCCGNGSQMLLVYQGWTGAVDGKDYNTYRIWGKMNPNPAVAETPSDGVRTTKPLQNIVRGVLFLPEASGPKARAASLLDISGRKVLDLLPGPNDVRALAPGVYFVREPPQAVRKVVLTR